MAGRILRRSSEGVVRVRLRERVLAAALWSCLSAVGCLPLGEAAEPTVRIRMAAAPSRYHAVTATESRGRICLNGMWEYIAVPGAQPFDPLHNRDLFPTPESPFPPVQTEDRPPSGEWQPILVPSTEAGGYIKPRIPKLWYRRSFTVPAEWEGRHVELEFVGASFEVVAYVNGQCVGWHRGDSTTFALDIGAACRFGQTNELLARVWCPRVQYGKVWPQALIENVGHGRKGIWDDVYLRSRPKIAVRSVFCRPSVRQQRFSADLVLVNQTEQDAAVTLRTRVLDLSGKPVHAVVSRDLALPAGEDLSVTVETPWDNARLWFPEDPHLYLLETELVRDGLPIDTHRERFGFRELWIEGGNFLLNGKIIRFRRATESLNPQNPASNLGYMRAWMRLYKTFGYNLLRTFRKATPALLEIADEEGLCVAPQSGWHHPDNPLTPEFEKNALPVLREWITRDRNHPCVVMWVAENEGYSHVASIKWAMDRIRELDPTRPVDADSSYYTSLYDDGNRIKDVSWAEIANVHYAVSWGPLSVVQAAAYPAAWAQDPVKPVMFGEWGDNHLRGFRVYGPHEYERFLGIRNRYSLGASITLEGTIAYCEAIIPHWRRYGVSGQNVWGITPSGHRITSPFPPRGHDDAPPNGELLLEWDRLDTPGHKFDRLEYPPLVNAGFRHDLPEFDIDAPGNWFLRRFAALNAPVLAFFPDRTRGVYAPATFERNLTLINDSMSDRRIGGNVRLVVDDRPVADVTIDVSLTQAGIQDHPIRFDLPAVTGRTPARVEIQLDVPGVRSHGLALDLDLFPPREPGGGDVLPRTWLYDPDGTTAPVLRKLGIVCRELADPAHLAAEVDTLVIGLRALDQRIVAARNTLLDRVGDGMRIVCLYQDRMLPWLPVECPLESEMETSIVWLLAPGDPLFEGVAEEDLSWWPNDRGEPLKVSGAVAVRPFRKPNQGELVSLLECGKGLGYSALARFTFGQGAVLLSQLAFEEVVGICPGADRMLANLIHAPAATRQRRRTWYAGDEVGRTSLEDDLDILVRPIEEGADHAWSGRDLIVWMPGASPPDAETVALVRRGVAAGAALLAEAPDAQRMPPVDAPPEMARAEAYRDKYYVFQAKVDPRAPHLGSKFVKMAVVDRTRSILDGLSNKEIFRSSRRRPEGKLADYVFRSEGAWEPLARPAIFVYRRQGDSEQLLSSVVREPDGSLKAAYRAMLHPLLVNLGATAPQPDAAWGAPEAFFALDLRPHCTMGFADKAAGDGKGGWSDQGPGNDLGVLPVGRQEFQGVSFEIVDPDRNRGKSCIVLGSRKHLAHLPREVAGIRVGGRKVRRLYFLHTSAYGTAAGEYRVHYAADTEMVKSVPITPRNIGDWWRPVNLPEAGVAWTGVNGANRVGLYLFAWDNPHPEIVIDSIDVVSKGEGPLLGLVAVSAAQSEPGP